MRFRVFSRKRTAAGLAIFMVLMITTGIVLAAIDSKPSTLLVSGPPPVPPPGGFTTTPLPDLGDGYSQLSSLSYNGRYVAFESRSGNLVDGPRKRCLHGVEDPSGDQVCFYHLYILDRGDLHTAANDVYTDDVMTQIIRAYDGAAPNNHSSYPIIWREPVDDPKCGEAGFSACRDGHYVVFQSLATNLIADDSNNQMDVFLYRWEDSPGSGTITRVSEPNLGGPGGNTESNGHSGGPMNYRIDPDGQYNHMPTRPNSLHNPLHPGADLYVAPDSGGNFHPFVLFESSATNLTADATGGFQQIFIRDIDANGTALTSWKRGGEVANGDSTQPVVSSFEDVSSVPKGNAGYIVRGRFVAFTTRATNLVDGVDPNAYAGYTNVVLLDRDFDADGILDEVTQAPNIGCDTLSDPGCNRYGVQTYLVSGSHPSGSTIVPGNEDSEYPSIAVADLGGSKEVRVAFHSFANNLISTETDSNGAADVFIFKLAPGATDDTFSTLYRVSKSSCELSKDGNCSSTSNQEGNLDSLAPALSGVSNVVSFTSYATNLVEGDNNYYCYFPMEGRSYFNCPDIYVRDLTTFGLEKGTTWRVSLTAAGRQARWNSALSRLSGSGQWVTLSSLADLRYDGDRLDQQQVYIRDQGFPPGNPVVRPSAGDFFAYTGHYSEVTFKFSFLADIDMTGLYVDVIGQHAIDYTILEDNCSTGLNPDGNVRKLGSTCAVKVRFDRETADLSVRYAQLVFPLPASDPRGRLLIDLRGFAVASYLPLISP